MGISRLSVVDSITVVRVVFISHAVISQIISHRLAHSKSRVGRMGSGREIGQTCGMAHEPVEILPRTTLTYTPRLCAGQQQRNTLWDSRSHRPVVTLQARK